jgi:hypothetical protein
MKKEKYISAIFAFILWGTWSYFINIKDENRFISSFFQGIASFFITIFMVRLIIVFNRLFINSSFYIVAILTVIITSSIVFIGHLLINTQNIFYTIAPTVVVSLLFSVFMAKKVSKIS